MYDASSAPHAEAFDLFLPESAFPMLTPDEIAFFQLGQSSAMPLGPPAGGATQAALSSALPEQEHNNHQSVVSDGTATALLGSSSPPQAPMAPIEPIEPLAASVSAQAQACSVSTAVGEGRILSLESQLESQWQTIHQLQT